MGLVDSNYQFNLVESVLGQDLSIAYLVNLLGDYHVAVIVGYSKG